MSTGKLRAGRTERGIVIGIPIYACVCVQVCMCVGY